MSIHNEIVSTTISADSVVSSAYDGSIQRKMDATEDSESKLDCLNCPTAALCGLVAVEASDITTTRTHTKTKILGEHGIRSTEAGICAGELVSTATFGNQSNFFWLLKTDELNNSTLDVRVAQTLLNAVKHIRHRVRSGAVK